MPAEPPAPLRSVGDPKTAALLLDGRKTRMLQLLRTPRSATGLGKIMGEPRQRINYHLGLLRRAHLVRPAGTRPRRGLTERLYQSTAHAYRLAPGLVDTGPAQDEAAGDGSPAFRLDERIRFKNSDQRAAFALYVETAVGNAIENHTHTAAIDAETAEPFRVAVVLRPDRGRKSDMGDVGPAE